MNQVISLKVLSEPHCVGDGFMAWHHPWRSLPLLITFMGMSADFEHDRNLLDWSEHMTTHVVSMTLISLCSITSALNTYCRFSLVPQFPCSPAFQKGASLFTPRLTLCQSIGWGPRLANLKSGISRNHKHN